MDPEQIQTGEQLAGQLRELFHLGGWRIHRLAERAGLSKATVQGILSGTTMIPQAGTLTEFVRACGQDPGPWVAARGRAVQAANAGAVTRIRVMNVPRTGHAFVGRADELEQLTEAMTLPGGSGTGGVVVEAVHGYSSR
jgi:transcriptional regulator with XRE-family HTH domain